MGKTTYHEAAKKLLKAQADFMDILIKTCYIDKFAELSIKRIDKIIKKIERNK